MFKFITCLKYSFSLKIHQKPDKLDIPINFYDLRFYLNRRYVTVPHDSKRKANVLFITNGVSE